MAADRLLGPIKDRRIMVWSSVGRVSRHGGDDIFGTVSDITTSRGRNIRT